MIIAKEEIITPEIAKDYLSKVDPQMKNRPINKRYVELYARDMTAGKWRITHQGIAFDKDGYLRDGQHRLNAIIKANVPVTMMVSRGLAENSYLGIDSGLKRKTRDTLYFSGEFYDDAVIRNDRILATIRSLVDCGYKARLIISTDCIIYLYQKMQEELNFIYDKIVNKRLYPNAHMTAAALAAILCGESKEDIVNYFSCYIKADITGCEDKNLNAVFSWHKQITDLRGKRIRMTNDKLYTGTQFSIWNFCRGTDVKKIKPTNNVRYPVNELIGSWIEEFNNGNL